MDILFFAFNAISPMLFPMALGVFISLRGQIKEHQIIFLSGISYRYFLVFQLFNACYSIDFYNVVFNPALVICTAGFTVGIMAAAWVVFSFTVKDKGKQAICIISSYGSNNVIYTYPLAASIFGEAGVRAAAIVVPITIIVYNFLTVIVMVYHSKANSTNLRETLKRTAIDVALNPLILACVLGIIFSLLSIKLPLFMKTGITSIGAVAAPIGLILLGAQINLKKLGAEFLPIIGICLLRLILVPFIVAPVLILLGLRGVDLGTLIISFATPCAAANLTMSRNYNIEPIFTAQTVYLSTFLSAFTIFFAVVLMRSLNLL
jgi:predicted permease